MGVFYLFSLLLSVLCLSACQRYAPVERHFLRVSAFYAAELSGIEREKWLKQQRKLPRARIEAEGVHYLKLSRATLPEGMNAPEGEVKFFPNEEGSRQGMVALNWENESDSMGRERGAGRLWLLKTEGGRYLPQPLTRWFPLEKNEWSGTHRYRLSAQPNAITQYKSTHGRVGLEWRQSGVLHWSRGQWVVGR